jgi:hypothetical protein
MNYLSQSGPQDCFPTCFRNAMLHFGIPLTPELSKRLEVFNNGTERCPIHAAQERLEQYPRSLNKFIAEWNWASGQKNNTKNPRFKPEAWAKYLLETGIDLEARNGPIENKKVILDALSKNKIVICNIWIPSTDFPGSKCSHYVLLVGLAGGKLLVHDPLPADWNVKFNTNRVAYKKHELGVNFEIDCEYFFSNEINDIKPKLETKRSDSDYSFLILSRS